MTTTPLFERNTRLLFLVDSGGFRGGANVLTRKFKVLEITSDRTLLLTEQITAQTHYRYNAKSETIDTTDNPEDILYMLKMRGIILPGVEVKYEVIGMGKGTTLYPTGIRYYYGR